MNPLRLKTISHFFEHYKDLEEGKWVKVLGWEGPDAAKKEIIDGLANYEAAKGEQAPRQDPASLSGRGGFAEKRPDGRFFLSN